MMLEDPMTDTDYTVLNDKGLDLSFTGVLLAEVSSGEWDNRKRWTRLRLFRTRGGSYVCNEIGESSNAKEKAFNKAIVAESVTDMVRFFGKGRLAMELYDRAKVDTAKKID